MGNGICNCNCDGLELNDENEVRIGHGVYGFKKMVNKFKIRHLFNIQFVPKDKSEEIFYSKMQHFEDYMLNSIEHKGSFVRLGISQYSNGNVEVVIPCPYYSKRD